MQNNVSICLFLAKIWNTYCLDTFCFSFLYKVEPRHSPTKVNVRPAKIPVYMCAQRRLRSACTSAQDAQSDQIFALRSMDSFRYAF